MTTSNREQLKKEICNYFLKSGVSREVLPKAIAAFKECADEGREFESCFDSRHHVALQDFQKRYWALDDSLLNATSSKMSKVDAEEIFADPQSSPSLLRAATLILEAA